MAHRFRRSPLVAVAALSALLALVLVLASGAARAEPPVADEALIREGVELRRAGKDEEALARFQAAYRLRATPHAQAQMGLAEQALGRWVEAARDLEAALQAVGDPWVAKSTATLQPALAAVETHLGRLQVLGSPPGAKVKVDEQDVGELPMPAGVRVPAGEVVITVSAAGHIPINRKVTIQPGASTRETIVLHATDAAPTVPAPVPAPAVEGAAPAVAPAPAVAASSAPGPAAAPAPVPGGVRVAAWVAGGAAVVALAVGVGENLSYLGKRSDFDDGARAGGPCGSALPGRGAAGCSSLYDGVQGAKTGAVVGYAATGVLGAASAALFYFSSHQSAERVEPRIACAPRGLGAGCAVTF
jgi:hypothetical protein